MSVVFFNLSMPCETFLERLMRGLIEKGHTIILVSKKKPTQKWLLKNKIKWVHMPKLSPSLLNIYLLIARWLTGGWDVVYFPWSNSMLSYHEYFFQKKAKIIVGCLGTQIKADPYRPDMPGLKEGLKYIFNKADAIHCVSDEIKTEVESYGVTKHKIYVIHQGVDTDLFRPSDNKNEVGKSMKLISVGSLISRKDHLNTLHALKILTEKGCQVRLSIIGPGKEQSVRYSVKDLGLKEFVSVEGGLDESSVAARLKAADIFILSSICEGIPNAAMEAMACELPTILTDFGGAEEIVQHGENGFIVPSLEPECLASQVEVLLENESLRKRVGEKARITIEKEFTLTSYVNQFDEMLQEINTN